MTARSRRTAAQRAATLHIRMSEGMLRALQKWADDELRSRHNLVRKLLADQLVARGYLTPQNVGTAYLTHAAGDDGGTP